MKKTTLTTIIILAVVALLTQTKFFSIALNELTTPSKSELSSIYFSKIWGTITGAQIQTFPTDSQFTEPGDIQARSSSKSSTTSAEETEEEAITGIIITEGSIIPTNENFHSVCKNRQCIIEEGEGENQCSENTDCINIVSTKTKISCYDVEASKDYPAGSNPFVKGSVTIGIRKQIDYCSSNSALVEWSCSQSDPSQIESKTIDCKELGNYLCHNGKCVLERDTAKCADSDAGKDFFIKGVLTFPDGKKREDKCIGSTTLQEFYCDEESKPSVIIKYCDGEPGKAQSCTDGRCIPYQGSPVLKKSPKKTIIARISGYLTKFFE